MRNLTPWLLAVMLPLSVALMGCDESSDSNSDVDVSGTITVSSWTTGAIEVVVYPQGIDPGPDNIVSQTSVAGAVSAAYTVTLSANQTVYVFAWNDVDGGGSPGTGEVRGCSGDNVVGTSDITGVDFSLPDEFTCATAP